jgi:methylase of polypeptide subunit release factors
LPRSTPPFGDAASVGQRHRQVHVPHADHERLVGAALVVSAVSAPCAASWRR